MSALQCTQPHTERLFLTTELVTGTTLWLGKEPPSQRGGAYRSQLSRAFRMSQKSAISFVVCSVHTDWMTAFAALPCYHARAGLGGAAVVGQVRRGCAAAVAAAWMKVVLGVKVVMHFDE